MFSSLACGFALAHDALADPVHAAAEPAASTDAPAAGKDAPPLRLGTRATRALGLDVDTGPANSGLASQPLGLGTRATFDSFLLEGLSIGGSFGFEYSEADSGFYNVGGGPRVGYALPLGAQLALWPRISITYDAGIVPDPKGTKSSLQDVRVGAYLPIVYMLGGQVGLELGPTASTDLWRRVAGQPSASMDLVGLRFGLIGWF